MLALIFFMLLVALVFEYINGFHDSANSIATIVSTKVLTPRQAVLLAAGCNLLGAFFGEQVAKTISSGIVEPQYAGIGVVVCALMAGIVWNLVTWWFGLPSSSSHALIGGLIGAALAVSGGKWSAVQWATVKTTTDHVTGQVVHHNGGLLYKVVVPMITSPLFGLMLGFVIMALLLLVLKRCRVTWVNAIFGRLQMLSAALMGFSHGANDATKTMGIITLALYTATRDGAWSGLPSWLSFLQVHDQHVPSWVKIICALTMAAGTAAGGWRIIRTMGHKMVRLQPIHGFAAETTAAAIIQTASHMGIPLSTTHVISTSIMGVGATKRFSAVKWGIVGRMVWAWVLTIPVTAFLGYGMISLYMWLK